MKLKETWFAFAQVLATFIHLNQIEVQFPRYCEL